MQCKPCPVIDMAATGKNIVRLRKERGMTVRDLQAYFGFEEPQAIYKWQCGKSLPSVDNLYALGALLNVPMEDILVPANAKPNLFMREQQDEPCCSNHFVPGFFGHGRNRRTLQPFWLMRCASDCFQRSACGSTISPFARRGFFHFIQAVLAALLDGDVWLMLVWMKWTNWRIGCLAWIGE